MCCVFPQYYILENMSITNIHLKSNTNAITMKHRILIQHFNKAWVFLQKNCHEKELEIHFIRFISTIDVLLTSPYIIIVVVNNWVAAILWRRLNFSRRCSAATQLLNSFVYLYCLCITARVAMITGWKCVFVMCVCLINLRKEKEREVVWEGAEDSSSSSPLH